MGSNLQTGRTSITGSVTASVTMPLIPAGATIRNYCAVGNGAVQSAITITAGKIGYVMVFAVGGSAANVGIMYATNGTTQRAHVTFQADDSQVIAPSYPIASYAAGEIVKVLTPASATVTLVVIEVDA